MSAWDVEVKAVVFLYVLPAACFVFLATIFVPRWMKQYIHKVYTIYFNSLQAHREKLLSQIQGKGEPINILELRLNQGENLDFYPERSAVFVLTATEAQAMGALRSRRCRYARAEPRLRSLKHFDDAEIDVVVGTSALCRCEDQRRLLAEIHRVLVPDGKYIFIEHTNAQELNPFTYVFKEIASILARCWFFDMCHLNSEPTELLESVGFRSLSLQRVSIQSDYYMLKLIQNHVIGVAVK